MNVHLCGFIEPRHSLLRRALRYACELLRYSMTPRNRGGEFSSHQGSHVISITRLALAVWDQFSVVPLDLANITTFWVKAKWKAKYHHCTKRIRRGTVFFVLLAKSVYFDVYASRGFGSEWCG